MIKTKTPQLEPIKRQGCEYYKKCGGCQLRNLTYAEQLNHKQARVIRLLGGYCHISPIMGMDDPTHYRHKAQAAFGRQRGALVAGIYRSSEHTIVPVKHCAIQERDCDEVIQTAIKLARELDISVFDERVLKGGLRHIQVRKGYFSGQVMAILVTGEKSVKGLDKLVAGMVEKLPFLTTVVQNINNAFTNMVLGDKNFVLYGPGFIEDSIGGMVFRISPGAFYQVNPKQTEVLYKLAVDYMDLSGSETVIDAYCGTGTIGLLAAKGAKKVIGVELNPAALRDAKVNAAANGINNAEFICGDAGDFAAEYALSGNKCDVLIMDPPRTGSDIKFLKSVAALAPKRIVYVSCNPETLARDLRFLTNHGYKAKKITPVDMFPFTDHIETVVLMSRKKD